MRGHREGEAILLQRKGGRRVDGSLKGSVSGDVLKNHAPTPRTLERMDVRPLDPFKKICEMAREGPGERPHRFHARGNDGQGNDGQSAPGWGSIPPPGPQSNESSWAAFIAPGSTIFRKQPLTIS